MVLPALHDCNCRAVKIARIILASVFKLLQLWWIKISMQDDTASCIIAVIVFHPQGLLYKVISIAREVCNHCEVYYRLVAK